MPSARSRLGASASCERNKPAKVCCAPLSSSFCLAKEPGARNWRARFSVWESGACPAGRGSACGDYSRLGGGQIVGDLCAFPRFSRGHYSTEQALKSSRSCWHAAFGPWRSFRVQMARSVLQCACAGSDSLRLCASAPHTALDIFEM